MKPRKKRTPSTEPAILPAELADNLTYLERQTQISEDEALYNSACDLLAMTGIKAQIDGEKVTVTKYAYPFTSPDGERTFYARIAQYDNDPLANTRARVIFDDSPSADTITTGDAAALVFCDMGGGNTTLLAYDGINPIMNNDEYRNLTRQTIEHITEQYNDEQQRILVERRLKRKRALTKVGAAAAGAIVIAGAVTVGMHATDDNVGPEQETTASNEDSSAIDVVVKPTPEAGSQYGVCASGGAIASGGMVCDYDVWPDGSFLHMERVNVFGFQSQNVYRACPAPDGRPIPTDYDPATPC